jgi:hypothetical protein
VELDEEDPLSCISEDYPWYVARKDDAYRAQIVNIGDPQRGEFGRKLVGYDLHIESANIGRRVECKCTLTSKLENLCFMMRVSCAESG